MLQLGHIGFQGCYYFFFVEFQGRKVKERIREIQLMTRHCINCFNNECRQIDPSILFTKLMEFFEVIKLDKHNFLNNG